MVSKRLYIWLIGIATATALRFVLVHKENNGMI